MALISPGVIVTEEGQADKLLFSRAESTLLLGFGPQQQATPSGFRPLTVS